MRRPRPEPGPPINERLLRLSEVRVVGETGDQLGVMSSRDALNRAREAGLDLVLVAEKAQPPVVRIVDYGKYKYEKDKREKESRKTKSKQEVKGIKLSPNIAEHDLQTQIRKARSFLEEGDKVRVVCRFRQRELAHPKVGAEKIQMVVDAVEEVGKPDKEPTLSGKEMVVVINPKQGVKPKPKAEADRSSKLPPEAAAVLAEVQDDLEDEDDLLEDDLEEIDEEEARTD